MLHALGLGDEEDAVYAYLLGGKPSTVEDVQAGTTLRRPQARRALSRLERAGFVVRLPGQPDGRPGQPDGRPGQNQPDPGNPERAQPDYGRPERFAAQPPGAVDAAISRRLADLREAQIRISRFAARYRAERLEADGAGVFEVIRGADALRVRAQEMVAAARSEALNMLKPPLIAVQPAEHVEPDSAVRGRVVFDRDLVTDAGVLDAIRARPGTHYEVRVHTLVPVKMLAIDRSMALLPVRQNDDAPVGVLITESAVLDSFLALFDYVWQTAVTLPSAAHAKAALPGRSPLTAEDSRLLSLLLAGLTDQAIAGHFRVSVRTVERRIRALMDAARVRTRTQLAWEAARQDWL